MPDADGYPTDEEIEKIKAWPMIDLPGWFAFIKSCWWAADWGWTERETEDRLLGRDRVRRYDISTGGWSGNEAVIDAMEANKDWCWFFSWVSSRRGGHYSFEHPVKSLGPTASRPLD